MSILLKCRLWILTSFMLCFCCRWKWTIASERWSDVYDLTVLPMAPYLLWACLYYLKIFVISSKRIEQRGYETLYKYMISDTEGMCGKVMHRWA